MIRPLRTWLASLDDAALARCRFDRKPTPNHAHEGETETEAQRRIRASREQ